MQIPIVKYRVMPRVVATDELRWGNELTMATTTLVCLAYELFIGMKRGI